MPFAPLCLIAVVPGGETEADGEQDDKDYCPKLMHTYRLQSEL
jgi:hypothetical protein